MSSQPSPFTIGEWHVVPQLNRLRHADGREAQVEPKMMDVLVRLAETPGDVVSREALIDAVWPEVFISESVLTRAIAGLRRALGDDAKKPLFIETISKRGYRLVGVEKAPQPSVPMVSTPFAGGAYVVGQWVRGEAFYGRRAEIAEVLYGPRNGFWVVGTRRRGKTSFLKQLEHIAVSQPERRLAPVFWDLQGVDDLEALAFSLEEALADAESTLAAAGVVVDAVLDDDVFRTLGAVRRRLRAEGWTLLLLCDEAETLRVLAQGSEAPIGRLRRALLAQDGVRTVLSSGPRLWDLATGSSTSPFLDGFLPPLYLGALDDGEATALVLQSQSSAALGPDMDPADVAEICSWSGGHPFLLQLLSKRFMEHHDVKTAVDAVVGDRSVTSLFEVDLDLLDDEQRSVLRQTVRGHAGSFVVGSPSVAELRQLGLLELDEEDQLRVALPLLRRWLDDCSGARRQS